MGDNWPLSTEGLPANIQLSISQITILDNLIYLPAEGSTGSDYYLSDDLGQSWQTINLAIAGINAIQKETIGMNTTYVAVGSDGISTSSDGINWSKNTTNKLKGFSSIVLENNQYFASTKSGVYFSTDQGNSWLLPHSIYSERTDSSRQKRNDQISRQHLP